MADKYIICYNCGEVSIDRSRNARGKFCSKKCYQEYSNKLRGAALDEKMRCIYNSYVVCVEHNCQSCGWNPEVETKRKAALA